MYQELVIALMLGLIGGLIPGPVLTAVFTEILQAGLARSMRIILIALLTESIVAVLSLLLFSGLGLSVAWFRGISIAGAFILVWIATGIWKVKSLDKGEKVYFSPWKIILMIGSNGVLWTYWITICVPKAILLSEQLFAGEFIFLGLVQLGWLLSTVLAAILFSRLREFLSRPRVIPLLFKIFSLAFVYFALDMLIRSIRYFLEFYKPL